MLMETAETVVGVGAMALADSMTRERKKEMEARLHFNDLDPRALQVKRSLGCLLATYGEVAQEIVEVVRSGLQVFLNAAGKVERALLSIPCAREDDWHDAEKELFYHVVGVGSTYRLVSRRRESDGDWLDFELVRQVTSTDPQTGREKRQLQKLPSIIFQRLITRWLRPPALNRLPRILHDGVSQEIGQVNLSNVGLRHKGQSGETSLPDFTHCVASLVDEIWRSKLDALASHVGELETKPLREVLRGRFAADDPAGDRLVVTDPLWTQCKPLSLKTLGARFTQSVSAKVCLRREKINAGLENEREQVRLYVALPIGAWLEENSTSESNLYWWRSHLGEFSFLPPWQNEKLTARNKYVLIPLSVQGGHRRLRRYQHNLEHRKQGRFVRELASPDWRVAWSMLVERMVNRMRKGKVSRQPEYFLQLTLAREQEVLGRPNLLGVHFAQEETPTHFRYMLYWSCLGAGEDQPSRSGKLVAGALPKGGRWPHAAERKRLAYRTGHQVAQLAHSLDAELALERVSGSGVKKRTRDGTANRVATRFNYSQLTLCLHDVALNHLPAIDVYLVSDYCLRDSRDCCHAEQAAIIVRQGWRVRESAHLKRDKKREADKEKEKEA